MKKAFTLNIEDDTKIVGLQIAVAIQRESNDEWLFKFNEKAKRITTDNIYCEEREQGKCPFYAN